MEQNNNHTSPCEEFNQNGSEKDRMQRRDFLKGLATLPIFGAFFYEWMKKRARDHYQKHEINEELDLGQNAPAVLPQRAPVGDLIRLGIIG